MIGFRIYFGDECLGPANTSDAVSGGEGGARSDYSFCGLGITVNRETHNEMGSPGACAVGRVGNGASWLGAVGQSGGCLRCHLGCMPPVSSFLLLLPPSQGQIYLV